MGRPFTVETINFFEGIAQNPTKVLYATHPGGDSVANRQLLAMIELRITCVNGLDRRGSLVENEARNGQSVTCPWGPTWWSGSAIGLPDARRDSSWIA